MPVADPDALQSAVSIMNLSREGSIIQHMPRGGFSRPGNPLQGVSALAVKCSMEAGASGPVVLPLSTR